MSGDQGRVLLPIARASIGQAFGRKLAALEDAPWLQESGATFVTLKKNAQLRGCIGSLEAHCSVLEDVKANAKSAAFRDPRFAPLGPAEFDAVKIEVSLLSSLSDMHFVSEQDALSQLRPGIDGLVFRFGRYRSTFLPAVWESLPMVGEFVGHLKQKAGLSFDFWAEGIVLQRYTVSKWEEPGEPGEQEY